MEKYITDNGYGAKKSDAIQGYSNENTADEEASETWLHEYKEEQDYKNIGFGRDTGDAR